RHPRIICGLLMASVVGALALAPGLQFDFSPQGIYRGDQELVGFSEEFKRTFGYDEAVVLVVLEALGEDDVLDAPALEWQREIAGDLARIDSVCSVESLSTLEAPRPSLTGLTLAPLVAPGPIDDDIARHARGLFSTQPLIRSGMLSDDERVAAIPVFL